MRKFFLLGLFLGLLFVTGCNQSHNFMDVDNPNAKDDLLNLIGTGNIPDINANNIIPDSLSGTWQDVKGYANKQMEDTFGEYVDKAKQGLSGAKETVKGFYNDSLDDLNEMISEKVNGVISGELNKFKIK